MRFSAFDVLDGDNIYIDKIYFDGREPEDIATSVEPDGRIVYEVHGLSLKNTNLKIEKNTYFPFANQYSLDVKSIYDDEIIIDLGRIRNAQ